MKKDEFLAKVEQRGEYEGKEQAAHAVRAVLETLGERLTGDEAKDLAAQLPEGIAGLLSVRDSAQSLSVDEFLDKISSRLDKAGAEAVRSDASAVLTTVAESIEGGSSTTCSASCPPTTHLCSDIPNSRETQQMTISDRVVIGLEADPGPPTALAGQVAQRLPDMLARQVSDETTWEIKVSTDELTLDGDGRIPIEQRARERMPAEGWDVIVCLTDLPRRNGTQPVVADIRAEEGVALASLPAIGWARLLPHLANVLVHIIGMVVREKYGLSGHRPLAPSHHHVARRATERISPVRQVPSSDVDVQLTLSGVRGRARLLCGMARDNRPWRLVPSLSKAIAAAMATAAFGIFYPTMWSMADALSTARLALISFVAISAMVTWLVIDNGLWERGRDRNTREEAFLYNVATLLTLFIGVACMYIVLFALTWLASLAVTATPYLSAVLGHPADAGDYATLVWLASSMGTIAGAVGSSLETRNAVMRATYSKREQERRKRAQHRQQQTEHHAS
ncbi:uncharacterized protein (DUF2267 family) [Saccharopolyspora erythraea NRRL 2338]|uniref:Uncharacterized protein n=2 Tax=Saccharopolyspora erythraea TaxID=1836 RepID=A4FJA6_SACEN|nr:DUF2267 domain-containing protein [Saccharopolyspora erythraea]EQD85369.1 hypothetical protein N599_15120 [Saccharopolyspora erythraea D]PFG97799.1 uncharacterized protein (DUF2267 family) [Saccharopolyspora erythraea NRRL 2338]QRK87940.1 DUF2267 domain-containing protein [Saccharopolyspora erythraea]CAM04131.1 hypothetical protein SACE_4865 [Saccharopolyspora erythraea NRRL 2338]